MVPRLQTMQQLPLELTISGDTRLPAAIAGAYDIPRYMSPGSHAVNGLRHHAFRYVTYYQPPQQQHYMYKNSGENIADAEYHKTSCQS